jgi:enterochelin esterase-like enzyme
LAIVVVLAGFAVWGALRVYRHFVPDQHGATVTRFRIQSKYLGRSIDEILVTPKGGGAGRPLLALLHGRSSSPSSYLTQYWFDALAKLGRRAPDLLLVNGGDHSYYHDRADGRWGSYLFYEAIPIGDRKAKANGVVAIGGISMGGYGALLAGLRNPGIFCAVGGHSAAMWRTGGETPQGAFDNAEDFDRNNVMAMAASRRYPLGRDTRVWIDVGNRDPFVQADTELAYSLRAQGQRVVFHVWPGEHSGSYWNKHVLQYLRFYASALASC